MSNIAVLCDENGNEIGHKDRYSLEPGDIIQIASLWVENSKGEILIAQRSPLKKHDPGLWGPAAAGTMEPGETFESNIIKEAEEEIGLRDLKPVELTQLQYWRPDGIGRYAAWFIAKVDQPAEEFVLQEEEVAAVRWISKEELLAEVTEHPERFVGDLERWQKMLELSDSSKVA